MRDYKEAQRARLPRVKELYVLGFTNEDIAKIVDVSTTTIKNDLQIVRAEADPERIRNLQRRYTAVFAFWLNNQQKSLSWGQEPSPISVLTHVRTWLQIDALQAFAKRLETAYEGLHDSAESQRPYRDLLATLFNPNASRVRGYTKRSELFETYLDHLRAEPDALPASREDAERALIGLAVETRLSSALVAWPEDGLVERMIDVHLLKLPEHLARVLRMRFGIGCANQTLKEIGETLGKSPERMRHIEAEAIRWLQNPQIAHDLRLISDPVAAWRAEVERQRRALFPEEIQQRLELLDFLLTPIQDICLSVRSENCLRNLDLKLCGEVVQKKELELLNVPNFGRKSIKEVKEVIASHGAEIGMKLDDEMRNAVAERRRELDEKEIPLFRRP